LDLHMPIMDGLQVLAAVRGRIEFQNLPIVVLSSGEDPMEIEEARQLGARDYIVKPIGVPEQVEMVLGLYSRWLAGRDRPQPADREWLSSWGVRPAHEEPKTGG